MTQGDDCALCMHSVLADSPWSVLQSICCARMLFGFGVECEQDCATRDAVSVGRGGVGRGSAGPGPSIISKQQVVTSRRFSRIPLKNAKVLLNPPPPALIVSSFPDLLGQGWKLSTPAENSL
jgi:hypothetical protein